MNSLMSNKGNYTAVSEGSQSAVKEVKRPEISVWGVAKYALLAGWGAFSIYAVNKLYFSDTSSKDISWAFEEVPGYVAPENADNFVPSYWDYMEKRAVVESEVTVYRINSTGITNLMVYTSLDVPVNVTVAFNSGSDDNGEYWYQTEINQSSDSRYKLKVEYTPDAKNGLTVSILPASGSLHTGYASSGASADIMIMLPKSINRLDSVSIDVISGNFNAIGITRDMLQVNTFEMSSRDASFNLDGLNFNYITVNSQIRPITGTFTVNSGLNLNTVSGDIVAVTEFPKLLNSTSALGSSVNVTLESVSGNILAIVYGANYTGFFEANSLNGNTSVTNPSRNGVFQDLLVANFGKFGNYTSNTQVSSGASSSISLSNNSGESNIVFI
ncbi:hypothetical protein AYI68_g3523 [Smittium mucronatum]|uniref:DUF4097 domain-containing protein n=1 Tax=Smittium mucronatum TaxID=133383 RepID=A0A1R0GZQ0_9FUNG|nr:hypothetical protein AYI68_g3523 [Smittium mucronatum]